MKCAVADAVVTVVTKEEINKAFDTYIAAFEFLANKEDELDRMKDELAEYNAGGAKYKEAEAKIHVFEHEIIGYQRRMRLAGIAVDRVRMLVQAGF